MTDKENLASGTPAVEVATEACSFRSKVNSGNLNTIDCGKNTATWLNSKTGEVETISKDEVIDLPFKIQGEALAGEDAHFGIPKGPESMAQPFSSSQLEKFYKNCESANVSLKLISQKQTPRALCYANLEKSDETDPIAIHKLITDFPQLTLKNPDVSCFSVSTTKNSSYKIVKDITKLLNYSRMSPAYESGEVTEFIKSLLPEMRATLSDETLDAMGLTEDCLFKVKSKKGQINLKKVKFGQLYTIASLLMGELIPNPETEDVDILATPRIQPGTGRLASWKYIKSHILRCSPFHENGGTARSNIYYHGAKSYIIRKAKEQGVILKGKQRGSFNNEEDKVFRHYRNLYIHTAVREVFEFFKSKITV